jgi:hypothetical protein
VIPKIDIARGKKGVVASNSSPALYFGKPPVPDSMDDVKGCHITDFRSRWRVHIESKVFHCDEYLLIVF